MRLLVVCLVLVVASGCGGSGAGSGGYLASDESGAMYLQWTRDGSDARGSLTLARLESRDDGRLELERDEAPFTAVVDDERLTLTFQQEFGLTRTWSGEIDGDAIELSYQVSDGSLQTVRLEPASIDEFNRAVAQMQERIAAADAQADEAEATQAAAEERAQLRQEVERLGEDVHARLEGVSAREDDFAPLVAEAKDGLARTRAAHEKVEQALVTARAAGADAVCYEAGSVDYEAGGVEYELGGIRSVRDGLASISSALDDEINTLEQAMSDYETLAASLPEAVGDVPSNAQIESAISGARAAERAARRAVATAITDGESLLASARELAAAAQRECDSRGT